MKQEVLDSKAQYAVEDVINITAPQNNDTTCCGQCGAHETGEQHGPPRLEECYIRFIVSCAYEFLVILNSSCKILRQSNWCNNCQIDSLNEKKIFVYTSVFHKLWKERKRFETVNKNQNHVLSKYLLLKQLSPGKSIFIDDGTECHILGTGLH